MCYAHLFSFFFFQAEDGIRDLTVTGVQTCALPIYVAVDAPRDHSLAELVGQPMLASLMARETLLREPGDVALAFVHVVAGRARQVGAGAKAPAAAQQGHLIPVNIRDRNLPLRRRQEIVVEVFTRAVGERHCPRVPLP